MGFCRLEQWQSDHESTRDPILRRSLGQPGRSLAPESHDAGDRKSTRLNSSHLVISYAVFCLKKKNHIPGALNRSGEPITIDSRIALYVLIPILLVTR